MKTLNNSEVSLMESLVSVGQKSLQAILYNFLKKNYEKVTFDESFIIAEGDIPIALLAHMDTVFQKPVEELFYDRQKNVMWSPQGMGADDRAGIYAIIQIVKAGYRPHIIFTTDEEIGAIGAQELALYPCPFKDLRYMIQLDRRNSNDCVFYDCDNEEFEKYVESFGFVAAYGSFTDICELCPSWGIAGVNLSIGYRDEHSKTEILFVGQMLATIEKVKKMLSAENIPNFKFIPIAAAYSYYNWYGKNSYLDDYDYYNTPFDFQSLPKNTVRYKCHCCGKAFSEDEVLDVQLIRGGKGYFCCDCLVDHVDWCAKCGQAFEIDPKDPHSKFCKTCKKIIRKKSK